jgi:multidrug efflux pump subunit AcrB
MVTLAIVVLGGLVIARLPVDLLPAVTYPRIGVRADAPGVSPEVAIEEITRPLEQALSATDGVTQVISDTREGRIRIDLYFRPGGDIDQALNDANATLNRARDSLPNTISQPRLFKFDPSQLPIYELALTSASLPGDQLRVFADEELARSLGTVPGVASVDVSGGADPEVRVNIDPQRLQRLGLGLTDVLEGLGDRNQDTSGGRLQGESAEPLTRVAGRFQSADEIRSVLFEVPGTDPPQSVYLRDFAEVVDGSSDQRIFVSLNGQPAVKVSVQKQPDANTVTVVKDVKERLAALEEGGIFPANLETNVTLDESVFIQNALRNVTLAGLTGAGLAAITVLLFLGSLRQTVIIVLAIPLATLGAVLLLGLFGLSLNVFSLGGLALGVGIVVDNAIVMLENITQGIDTQTRIQAQTPQPAGAQVLAPSAQEPAPPPSLNRQIERSSQELESAVLASTLTNLVAVLPFLLIGGFLSLLFSELVLTISFAVAASLVVALTVVPALAAKLLPLKGSSGVKNWGLIRAFNQRLQGLTQRYRQALMWVLHRRMGVLAIAFLVLGGSSLAIVGRIPQEILPRISTGQAEVWVSLPPGTTLAENQRVMAAVDEQILAQPETAYAFTTAGGFLFGSGTSENVLNGRSTITLIPGSNVEAVSDRLNSALGQLNLVDTRLRVSPDSVRGLILSNTPVRADVDVILQGNDSALLNQAGFQVLSQLNDQASQARYIPDGDPLQPEIQIRPDWERAAALGISAETLGETVQTLLNGAVATQLQRGDRLVDVRVQLPDTALPNPEALKALPIFVDGGQAIRLGDVARIETGQAPGTLQRIDQRQVFIIEGNLTEDATLSTALAEVDQILADVELPPGILRLPSFAAASNQQIQQSLKTLGGLAIFLVFAVMAVQYNTLIDPLVILLTVPLALTGGIWGLFITQTPIGATVVVGAVLLVGIVVNNAIILVELANQIRDRTGCSPTLAMVQAAPQRLRPILMTTITTVLGLFPLALGLGEGSEFLQPMGIVVFSGLSLATGLTLFVIPCFYTLLHREAQAV